MTDDQVARFNKRLKKIDKALEDGTITEEDPFPPEREKLFTSREAAEYCGMTWDNFRAYLRAGKIKPDKGAGRLLIFYRSTLDTFKAQPRASVGYPAGRPRKPKENDAP